MFENCFDRLRQRSALVHNITNYVTVNDVANILLFLASDESRTITGQSIDCDCGCYL